MQQPVLHGPGGCHQYHCRSECSIQWIQSATLHGRAAASRARASGSRPRHQASQRRGLLRVSSGAQNATNQRRQLGAPDRVVGRPAVLGGAVDGQQHLADSVQHLVRGRPALGDDRDQTGPGRVLVRASRRQRGDRRISSPRIIAPLPG